MGSAGRAVWRGTAARKVVALTFDDGPQPGITEALVDLLAREKAPSTFFVLGRHAAAYPDLVKRMADCGMQVENHTYTHPNLTLLPPPRVERELLRTMAAVRAATGKATRYFRPPGGNIDEAVSRTAARLGMAPCMYTVGGDRLEKTSADDLVRYVLAKARPGSIILLHNGRLTTIQALPRIIEGLRRRGYGFVTVNGLVSGRG